MGFLMVKVLCFADHHYLNDCDYFNSIKFCVVLELVKVLTGSISFDVRTQFYCTSSFPHLSLDQERNKNTAFSIQL